MSIETLKEDISRLRELKERMQRVREVPPMLMKGAGKVKTAEAFEGMREISQHGVSEETQKALGRARDSLAEDGSGIRTEERRQKRKRT